MYIYMAASHLEGALRGKSEKKLGYEAKKTRSCPNESWAFVVGLFFVKLVPKRKGTHDLKSTHARFARNQEQESPRHDPGGDGGVEM